MFILCPINSTHEALPIRQISKFALINLIEMKIRIIFLALVLSTFSFSFKPAAVTEGSIKYDVSVVESDLSYLEEMMIGMSTLSISFKDEAVRTDFEISIANTTVIHDGATKKGLMLISSPMGNKAVKLDNEVKGDEVKGKYKIDYLSDTKTIAGYKCKKAVITLDDGTKLNVFYTDQITPKNRSTKYTFEDLKGFPLEMEVKQEKMIIKLVAENVNTKPLDKAKFSLIIPSGYEETTMEELSKFGQ